MKQFVLPKGYAGEHRTTLTGSDFHYLCTVRRYRAGDSFVAVDRAGGRHNAKIVEVDKHRCVVSLFPLDSPSLQSPVITLFQCMPKGSKMDQIVRQATETGVRRIVPVVSEHTVPNIQGKEDKKLARWRRISEEAVQQSSAPAIPEIDRPTALAAINPTSGANSVALYFDSDGVGSPALHEYLAGTVDVVDVVIGPEGGFSAADIAELKENGFGPAYLGRQVLRSETAAVYAVAAIRVIVAEKEKWTSRSG
jgi:16S rRNA (uracil1498-N3)-methyltransferase